jgi:sterol desaturase/sphingolipid hydroxylase (fatty acid hydroxylase superfamily)
MVVISAGLAWLERRYPYATKSQMPRSRAVSAMYKRVPFYNVAAISILWYLLNFTGFSKGGFIPIGSLIHESSPASAVLTVLLLWLIYTGVDGTLHYLRHRSDLLWNIHKTHHSDTAMDLSTTVFRSEAEIAFNLVAFMVLFGVVISAPWWAILAAFGIESAMQLLHHANFRPAPWLLSTAGRVVQFPPHHRIHHSRTHQGYFWTFQPYNYLYELVNANAMPAIENAHNYQTGFEESADPRPGFDERRRADSAHSGRVDTGK